VARLRRSLTSPEDLIRYDRKRKGKKLSNEEWESTTDPDARIARMKNGATHLAYKVENAVDLKNSIVVAGCVTPADRGDTQTVLGTLQTSRETLETVSSDQRIRKAVADKGYHETELIRELNQDLRITTYIPERNPEQRRRWNGNKAACRAFHGNRARCRREHGKALGRMRANIVERTFAHLLETGGLRRFTLRGLDNVRKRYLVHVLAYNLGVLMRELFGYGTPRSLQDQRTLFVLLLLLLALLFTIAQTPSNDDLNK
jgi:transposase